MPLSVLLSAGGGLFLSLHRLEPPGGRRKRGEAREAPKPKPPTSAAAKPHRNARQRGAAARRPRGEQRGSNTAAPAGGVRPSATERGYIFSEGAAGYCVAIRCFDFRLQAEKPARPSL